MLVTLILQENLRKYFYLVMMVGCGWQGQFAILARTENFMLKFLELCQEANIKTNVGEKHKIYEWKPLKEKKKVFR